MCVGAPLRNWIFRLAMSLAAAAIVVAVWSAAAPLGVRLVVLAVIVGVALNQAFLRLPAFDPLGRIRWRLPASRIERRSSSAR